MILVLLMALAITPILPAPPKPPPPPQSFLTAGQLAQVCQVPADDPPVLRTLCLGYLAGSFDQVISRSAARPRPTVCPPQDFNLDQLRVSLLLYLQSRPQDAQSAAGDVVSRAASAAFPC